jgi:hypothetical protein
VGDGGELVEIDAAARRRVMSIVPIVGYVQSKVFRFRLEQTVQGTGGRAIVVTRQAGWQTPDPVQTYASPMLWIDCYADPDRDQAGLMVQAYAVARCLDVLHNERDTYWGAVGSNPGLRVVYCGKAGEPRLMTDADRHRDDDPLGDMALVRTYWRLITEH